MGYDISPIDQWFGGGDMIWNGISPVDNAMVRWERYDVSLCATRQSLWRAIGETPICWKCLPGLKCPCSMLNAPKPQRWHFHPMIVKKIHHRTKKWWRMFSKSNKNVTFVLKEYNVWFIQAPRFRRNGSHPCLRVPDQNFKRQLSTPVRYYGLCVNINMHLIYVCV